MAVTPICGFLRDQGDPPSASPCHQPATCMALADEIGDYVPACDECAAGKQTKRPQE